ncbi:MAG: hypothetical protein PHG16_08755 [Lachnospiraceae bacterium]|nr:hypothetical protein [Lachnospiraceae bacterium]
MNKLPKKVKRMVYGGIGAVLLMALLIFLLLFFPSNIEVTGNSRYSQAEIEKMVMKGPFSWNTLLMSWTGKHTDLTHVPFMDSVDVEYLNRNSLRLHVSEKYPVGYVEYEGNAYYFDKDGMVLESVTTDQLATQAIQDKITALEEQEAAADGASADSTSADSTSVSDSSAPGSTSDSSAAGSTSTDSGASQNAGGQFQPRLTDVSLVQGITFEAPAVDQKLAVPDERVFEHLYGLVRMINKYNIKPDSIELDESLQMTLHYGNARIALGADENLEEKMTRAAAILPKLTGMAGVLHLEEFTQDTQNIIFDKD